LRYNEFVERGFGLIEIVIVTAIVTIALFAFSQAGVLAVRLLRIEKENLEAMLLAQEALEAARSIRDESWTNNIAPLVNGAIYYPSIINGKWTFTTIPPPLINGRYMRYIVLNQIFRDTSSDKIAPSGMLDINTRKISARVEWKKNVGSINATSTVELITYFTNFLEPLGGQQEAKTISFEDATTDGNLANFPSNNAGDGDPAQSFTALSTSLQVTKVELYLRRTTALPSDIFAELRTTPTGTILGTSNIITSSTISNSTLTWVEFRFPDPVNLNALTTYHVRLRSIPSSTDAFSGSYGTINWGYKQTPTSPYAGGQARRYIGRLSNQSDSGQLLDQYDYGFKVYALQ